MIKKSIAMGIACIIFFVGGCLFYKYFWGTEEIVKIIEVERPVYTYTKKPENKQEFIECYKNQIKLICAITDQNYFNVLASDGCKKTEQKFKLGIQAKPLYNILTVSYVHNFNFRDELYMDMGASISYHRILFVTKKVNIGIGGGLTVTQNNIGFHLGPLFMF